MTPDIETPPLHRAVLDALNETEQSSVSYDDLAETAWESLSAQQRREALPSVLRAYVMQVFDEERARQLDEKAEDTTHTYLDGYDVAGLWDSVSTPANKWGEVPADVRALGNVLSELELLQHRLAMRDAEVGDES